MTIDEEKAHCTAHQYFSAGCGDCSTSALFQVMYEAKLTKNTQPIIEIGKPSVKLEFIRQQLQRVVYTFLTKVKNQAAHIAEEQIIKLIKLDDSETNLLADILLQIQWTELVDDVSLDLSAAVQVGAEDAISQLDITSKKIKNSVEHISSEYAKWRSAQMAGMRISEQKLVVDPDPKWSISETTKDDLKDIIERGFDEGISGKELAALILGASAFSLNRAALIAKTEIAMAQVKGSTDIWKKSGLVKSVNILLSKGHKTDDLCDNVLSSGPYKLERAPLPPLHPGCECSLIANLN